MTDSAGIHVAVLELPARWDARDEALDAIDQQLARKHADLLVVPELAFTGYLSPGGEFDLTRFAEPLEGKTIADAKRIAMRRHANLVVPLVLREGDTISNAAVLVEPSGELTVYRKRHPWIPEHWATPGHSPPPLVRIAGITLTFGICYDLHFLPEDATNELEQADLLVFTSAWVDDEATRLPQLSALATRFRVAIANANWGPGVVAIPGQGDSVLFDPHGAILARVRTNEHRADAFVRPVKKR